MMHLGKIGTAQHFKLQYSVALSGRWVTLGASGIDLSDSMEACCFKQL